MIGALYRFGVRAYASATKAYGIVDAKARRRARGASRALGTLAPTPAGRACYWMHCASVGEYEQGQPVWQALRALRPEARFVLSFFSPSGYEQFAPRAGHGEVVYLPWDRGRAPELFVGRLSPKLALFVKYEWWFGYYAALAAARVPTVLISASVRPGHPLLRPGGGPTWSPYRRALAQLTRVFARDRRSAAVLRANGGGNRVVVAGDTRVDRVRAVASEPLALPHLEAWRARRPHVLVAGSTWPPDERLLSAGLRAVAAVAAIIAPHEVSATAVARTLARFEHAGATTLSRLTAEFAGSVVVVDSIGLLARLYAYGDVAYVGGGFGAGIHNVLEPVAHGLAVGFGPRHGRFAEAGELIAAGVGVELSTPEALAVFLRHGAEPATREAVLAKAAAYLQTNAGATERVLDYLRERGYA